jgi:hypothetical protein
MKSDYSRHPLAILAPYLPLERGLTADGWWIGPLKDFGGSWRDSRFEELVRLLAAAYRTHQGDPIGNPTLIVSADGGADGRWIGETEWRALQLALDFTVLNGNPPLETEAARQQAGWKVATSDNAQLHFWPVDVEHGSIAHGAGMMVRVLTGGYTIKSGYSVPPPVELHIPQDRALDAELLGALLSVFRGDHDDVDALSAQRLARAVTWLSQMWRNTESIRWEERVVMLKTGFEALTGSSTSWTSAGRLEDLFRGLPLTAGQDFMAQYLLWKPSETHSMSREHGGMEYECTPLQHWFMSLAGCRNAIIHEGRATSLTYESEGSPYRGPYVFVGERLLREACRVALRRFGYDDLWKEWAVRVLSKSLQPILSRLLPPPARGTTSAGP